MERRKHGKELMDLFQVIMWNYFCSLQSSSRIFYQNGRIFETSAKKKRISRPANHGLCFSNIYLGFESITRVKILLTLLIKALFKDSRHVAGNGDSRSGIDSDLYT